MAIVATSEEQTDLLLNIREEPLEVQLNSAVQNNNNNNNVNPLSGKGGKFKSRALLCSQQVARLFPSHHRCFFHLTSIFQIILAVILLVIIPNYGKANSQMGGDNFSSLFFVGAITTSVLLFLMGLRKFWDSSFSICSKTAITSILRDSLLFIISLLGISYCCEVYRVPCQYQDGLFFLCIPFSIGYMTIKKNREKMNKHTKLVAMLTAFMALVFTSTVPMLAYRFTCRGHDMQLNPLVIDNDLEVGSIWILIYVIFIGLLTCSVCGFLSTIQDHEDSSSRSLEWTTWFHVFAFGALVCLFWTSVVPFVGVADGLGDFFNKLANVWKFHFSSSCIAPAKLGFVIPVVWLLFLYASNLLVYRFQSNPIYVIGNACLAIPLLSVVYSVFTIDQSGVEVKASLTLGCQMTMVLFPFAYVVLSCYHSSSIVYNLLDYFDIY